MDVTTPLVLPTDIVIVSVKKLGADVRTKIEASDDDFAISRPRSRSPSRIVDAETAELLKRFRAPTPIAEAVLAYSLARALDAAETLENAFPLLQKLVNAHVLVPEGSERAKSIESTLEPGVTFAGVKVLRCVQVLEDTEVYQAEAETGRLVALKMERPGVRSEVRHAIEREAEILERLSGEASPLFYKTGVEEERSFLLSAWCEGVPASTAANEWRRLRSGSGPERLLQLAVAICRAYALVHRRAVLHSDIHPRNVLACGDGSVRVIDFGLARIEADPAKPPPHRGGIGFYFEPEYARAHRLGGKRPPTTFLGEQYSLGALLYFLFTGVHYVDFSLLRDEMFLQIEEAAPLPFSQRGVEAWPEVERALGRALEKDPSRRFESVEKLAEELESAMGSAQRRSEQAATSGAHSPNSASQRLLRELKARLEPSGALFRNGIGEEPRCSVNYGAAGVAYGLYRFASLEGNPALLSAADLWIDQAKQRSTDPGAFYSQQLDVNETSVGRISIYHTASGIHCVQALVSHAMGDFVSMQAALNDFVAASELPCDNLDLTLGRSSTLIGCATLLEAAPASTLVDVLPIRAFGEKTFRELWARLDSYGPIGVGKELTVLGIAHGWAGILYAVMRWCIASGTPLPAGLETRLRELAECAELVGRGARWKRKLSRHGRSAGDYMAGWCNGSAGFVFLWTLAARLFRSADFTALAEKAAWNAWDTHDKYGSLCCGLAGCGYAFLDLYRHIGDRVWVDRARDVCEQAAADTSSGMRNNSLYKGDLGIAVLVADLALPETAFMPLFGSEGWRSSLGARGPSSVDGEAAKRLR